MSNVIPSGMEHLDWRGAQAASDRLHFLKNTPPVPTINGEPMTFPPYEYRPFPAAMYGEWTDERREAELRRVAGRLSLNLNQPHDLAICEEQLPEYDSRLVENEAERAQWQARGWATEPAGVKAAAQAVYERVAQAAAERAYSDRRMSDAAKAEFHAADVANGDEHLVDPPAPKKRGRPKRNAPPAQE